MKTAPLRIFISRELGTESVFAKQLKEVWKDKKSFEVIANSCLLFSPVAYSLPSNFDAICFYSQKGFTYFLEGLPDGFEKNPSIPLIAFGKATALLMEKNGWNANLVGDGTPEELSAKILEQFDGQNILFPQATTSRNSLQPLLENKLNYIPLVVYSNVESSIPNLGEFDALVFTSPKNVLSFSANNSFKGKIIAIGSSTATQLLALTNLPIYVANEPYELELANSIIKAFDF